VAVKKQGKVKVKVKAVNTKTKKNGKNGHTKQANWEMAEPVLGKVVGPPTMPLDQIVGMMKELEDAHRILDALELPPGTISERLIASARKWLRKMGGNTMTHPGRWAQTVIQAGGGSMWIKPEEMEAPEDWERKP
jgi:hypothetical protein